MFWTSTDHLTTLGSDKLVDVARTHTSGPGKEINGPMPQDYLLVSQQSSYTGQCPLLLLG
jgi:hypothetical protein